MFTRLSALRYKPAGSALVLVLWSGAKRTLDRHLGSPTRQRDAHKASQREGKKKTDLSKHGSGTHKAAADEKLFLVKVLEVCKYGDYRSPSLDRRDVHLLRTGQDTVARLGGQKLSADRPA